MQMLLFPDPRPLVERLGLDFFRRAPELPGVYLMRDAGGAVLYVGKARNLRRRLNSYRVANPDRVPRRHLRLLRSVARIELQECDSEASALARETELLRNLRPRFNRAGTWTGPARCLAWRLTERGLELSVVASLEPGWSYFGPLGAGADALRALVLRRLWCALCPGRGVAGMPAGWFHRGQPRTTLLSAEDFAAADLSAAEATLEALFRGERDSFTSWVRDHATTQMHPFEVAVREADLETLTALSLPQATETIG